MTAKQYQKWSIVIVRWSVNQQSFTASIYLSDSLGWFVDNEVMIDYRSPDERWILS